MNSSECSLRTHPVGALLQEEVAVVFVFEELAVATRQAVAGVAEQLERLARMSRARLRSLLHQRRRCGSTVFRLDCVFLRYLHTPETLNYLNMLIL